MAMIDGARQAALNVLETDGLLMIFTTDEKMYNHLIKYNMKCCMNYTKS